MMREERKLLITGCGRSGTLYASVLWQALGLDIRHERPVPPNGVMGRDGVASWFLAVDDPMPPSGPGPDLYRFEWTIHQVRHPLKVIASVAQFILKEGKYAPDFIERNVPEVRLSQEEIKEFPEKEQLILRAARYWLHWNLKAEQKANIRVRVEDLKNRLPDLCSLLGVEYRPGVLEKLPKNINGRHWHVSEPAWEVGWEDLRQLDPKLYEEICNLASRYGYFI